MGVGDLGTICRIAIHPYQTCHRRFQHWQRSGLLLRLLQKLAEDLRDRSPLFLIFSSRTGSDRAPSQGTGTQVTDNPTWDRSVYRHLF
jgi:hypothetical protein